MEMIMNVENDWGRNVDRDAVQGPVVCVSRDEVQQTLYEMQTVNAPGPSDVSLELIATSGRV